MAQRGDYVRVRVGGGETYEGYLYTEKEGEDGQVTLLSVVNDEIPQHVKYSVRVLNRKAVEHVEKVEKEGIKLPVVVPVDEEKLRQREEKALRAAHIRASHVGSGVSDFGQSLFDALVHTLPCHWDGKDIVVLGDIRVCEPYDVSHMKFPKEGRSMEVQRVQLVIEAHTKKYHENKD